MNALTQAPAVTPGQWLASLAFLGVGIVATSQARAAMRTHRSAIPSDVFETLYASGAAVDATSSLAFETSTPAKTGELCIPTSSLVEATRTLPALHDACLWP